MDWVSVNERLPPKDPYWDGYYDYRSVKVLIMSKVSGMDIASVTVHEDYPLQWILTGCDGYEVEGVTHWMPLPSPPGDIQ
jgi:hypothetical protein